MNAAPGIAVTQAEKHWITRSRVAGLRDPAIADPDALARAAGVDPTKLRFEWKDYLALDDASVLRRFTKRFSKPAETTLTLTNGALMIGGKAPYEWLQQVREKGPMVPGINSIREDNLTVTYNPTLALERFQSRFLPPQGVSASVAENGTLQLSGNAPWEWLDTVRSGAAKLPGISKISETNLKVTYDPKLVLQRFADRFGLPESVNAEIVNGVVKLTGEASHPWLMRVRPGAPTVPGITTIDEKGLVDVDQRNFQQSKSVIESAFVYFLTNKDNFATEGFAALSRLPDEIRRCLAAASRLGMEVQIEVLGYADAVGAGTANVELSQRRAAAVKDFLVKCGFDSSLFRPVGMGASAPAPGEARAEQANRRVALKIVPKS
jgi:outer membrane protein OmpA-like peptidoglycan-associated protein